MPELPEVETLRRSLEPLLLGRRIVAATLHRRDILILPGDPAGGFSRSRTKQRPKRVTPDHLLTGGRFAELRRRGKQLALITDDDRVLVIHLGMSGQLLHATDPPRLAHIHLTWKLDDGSHLVFRDPRRFGGARFSTVADLDAFVWGDLGPDALTILGLELHRRAGRARRAIKAALLDQAILAGVGNIYADEALFQSSIRPQRRATSMKADDFSRLATAVRHTLAAAITARGSTLRDYRDATGQSGRAQLAHRVYGRSGKPCVSCGKTLVSAQIAQRTTVFCRTCQK